MARLAHPLHELHVSLSVLSSFGVKLFAGILDNLPITELADRIKAISNSVDFTAIGQKFGAFVIAAINAWKAGRFGEFVALSFEIGFDKTVELFNEALSRMGKLVEAWDIGKIILSAISTGLFGLTKAVGTALITVLTTVIGTIDYILSAFQDKFNESLNKISSGIKTLYGAIGITVSNAPPLERKSLGFQEALAARGKEMEAKLDEFTATLDDWNSSIILALIPGAAGSAGTPGGLGGAGSPQQRMAKLMEEAQGGVTKAIEGSHHATEELNHSSSNLLVTYSKLRDVTDEMQVKAARLNELEQQRFAIENDFAMTEAEKWQKRRAILLEELEIRTRQAELQREAASRLSGKEADAALGRASGFDAQAIQVGRQLDAQGADPFSFPKQMASEWKKQLDAIGTFARATAQTVGNVFQTAFSGISAGISGVLRGTMTWGNALMNIGTNVMDAVIQGIVRMFAAWIAGIWAKQAAATSANSIEAVGAGIVAFFTSVSSYGAAGWLGLAAVLAGVGLVAAAAAGAFEAGGFTGPGPASQPAGIVHAGEYVFSAPAVQRIGVPTLAALHEGTGVAPGGAQGTTHFIVVDSMAAAEKMAQSRKGRSIYTRMGMEQSLEVGHVG
jgi:hypothetical protein